MYSISQKLKNVLKNKIKVLILSNLYKTTDFIIDNLFTHLDVNSKKASANALVNALKFTDKKRK